MMRILLSLFILGTALASYAEDCDEGLRRFLAQLTVEPSTAALRTQIDLLQSTIAQASHQDLKEILGAWEDSYLAEGPGHTGILPGLTAQRRGIRFLNLEYVEMVMVLNHLVSRSILGQLTQYTIHHPGTPLPDPLLYEFRVYLVLLKLFLEEKEPLPHVLGQLGQGIYFRIRPVPLDIKRQLEDAYYDPTTLSETKRLSLLQQWENSHLAKPGYLPDVAPKKDAGKRFLELDYQARRQVIATMMSRNYYEIDEYRETHPDQPLPEHLLDLFRIETILRMYYKPKFNDLLPGVLGTFLSSTLQEQIRTARQAILSQPVDLKRRMVAQWEAQQFKEKGYLMGLNLEHQSKLFSQLSYEDQVNVLSSFASTLHSAVLKHTHEHPLEPILPADIIFRVQIYQLLVSHLNDWVIQRQGCQDSLQEIIAQLSQAQLRLQLIQAKTQAEAFQPQAKLTMLTRWEDAEFEQSEHLPGLHHDQIYAGERFRTLAPQDQQTVINNLAQRIQDLVTPHQEQHADQPIPQSVTDQVWVYQILLEASRGGLPQD